MTASMDKSDIYIYIYKEVKEAPLEEPWLRWQQHAETPCAELIRR